MCSIIVVYELTLILTLVRRSELQFKYFSELTTQSVDKCLLFLGLDSTLLPRHTLLPAYYKLTSCLDSEPGVTLLEFELSFIIEFFWLFRSLVRMQSKESNSQELFWISLSVKTEVRVSGKKNPENMTIW